MANERPVITVREWARQQIPPVPERTALQWAATGHLPAYQSPTEKRGTWLVLADQPHPGPQPEGAAAYRRKRVLSQSTKQTEEKNGTQ